MRQEALQGDFWICFTSSRVETGEENQRKKGNEHEHERTYTYTSKHIARKATTAE